MSTSTTHTVSAYNSVAVADSVTAAVKAGQRVTVNGNVAVSEWGRDAARSWGNGTVSIKVKARTKKNAYNDVFFKVGTVVTVEVSA